MLAELTHLRLAFACRRNDSFCLHIKNIVNCDFNPKRFYHFDNWLLPDYIQKCKQEPGAASVISHALIIAAGIV